jgi:hypothetical protein
MSTPTLAKIRLPLLAAVAAFFFTVTPHTARAIDTAGTDTMSIPVATGEEAARSCYVHAMGQWNSVMASTPTDRTQLSATYNTFANCAKVSINTGKRLPNGQRIPWETDYFASTVGATYAQTQLASITSGNEQCSHLELARSLAQQAMETESETGRPDVQFESFWDTLSQTLKQRLSSCRQ